MTLNTFLLHDHEQRDAFVRAKGLFIAVRKSVAYRICLFSIDNFYAEVWYRQADHEVEMVRAFTNTELLEPYLESIDFSELISC